MRKQFEAFVRIVEQTKTPDHIKIWRFKDAPKELQDLSTHGGDEDWVAWVPAKYSEDYLGFMEEGTSFGCCSVYKYALPDGSHVWIGAHA